MTFGDWVACLAGFDAGAGKGKGKGKGLNDPFERLGNGLRAV